MTYTFHVGEPATTRSDDGKSIAPPHAIATSGPGGVQILIAVDALGHDRCRAVESGPIALGVSDRADSKAILIQIGVPGQPGYLEASAVADAGRVWWGADVELALCDGDGIVRAVRRFNGVEATELPPGGPGPSRGRPP